ncbi:hypothetical protein DE146DRAFT_626424 [Phaeosphaeria sp. MPI-PUGE-AT-0046c]|nr:hypothetical protein DE146DRAFT_626424 [Phaeosphaeria sp. MPI-PUGE-AT-0046c]
MGFERRSSVPTSYGFATTTTTISVISTTHDTVTVTPTASTFTGVVTSTTLITTVYYSTPVPTTVATLAGFNPLFVFAPAAPTANSRIKRYELEARDAMEALSLLKRQTPAGNTGGLRVSRNGTTSNIYRRYPQQLDCMVQITVSKRVFVMEEGPVETMYAEVDAATSMVTSVVSSTVTVTSVAPQETVWAACMGNNVVNSVEGTTGDVLIFDRVIYRPMEGFPLENERLIRTEDATECCIECQKTPFCAGSIYAPSENQCHIRLTQAPSNTTTTLPGNSSNSTLSPPFQFPNSTLSTFAPTGTSPSTPLSTAPPKTCKGSRDFYLGTVQGQTDFPLDYALWMSNGPCGRLSVWPVPVNNSLDTSLQGPPMRAKRDRVLGLGM